jgi:hypothetical protein
MHTPCALCSIIIELLVAVIMCSVTRVDRWLADMVHCSLCTWPPASLSRPCAVVSIRSILALALLAVILFLPFVPYQRIALVLIVPLKYQTNLQLALHRF